MISSPKNIEEIIVNLNIDKFVADEYYNSGWVFVNYIKPDYTYYKSDKKYNKKQYTKENIEKLLGSENYNNNLSETENMLNNNYLKVYDCGKVSLKYKRNS